MTDMEKLELERIHAEAQRWAASLTDEQRVDQLKKIGILDAQGKLSRRYGGEGEDTTDRRQSV